MPVVARITDRTRCPSHDKGLIVHGYGEVLICHKPVARKGDPVRCLDGSVDVIIEGDPHVYFGGAQVACKGHKTKHGAVIATGCPRVLIGRGLRNICKARAAKTGAAFIKYTAQKKRTPFITPTIE